jgi:hypothetical protein
MDDGEAEKHVKCLRCFIDGEECVCSCEAGSIPQNSCA